MNPSHFAREVAETMGLAVLSLREIVGQGEVNFVFVVGTTDGEVVVRFHRDPLDTDDYATEEWCMRRVGSAGVPVPEFVGRGVCEGKNFVVQRFVAGGNGDGSRSRELWRTLGGYARTINELDLDGSAPDSLFPRFGRDLVKNWEDHIAYNLGELTPADPLIALGAYGRADQDRLRGVFEGLADSVTRFGLTHGDLVPKNVILPEGGRPVVIDWGSASAGPVPFADFGRIFYDEANEGFDESDVEAFAEGYGVSFRELRGTLEAIRLLGKIDVCRWARDRRPDRLEHYVAVAAEAVRVA